MKPALEATPTPFLDRSPQRADYDALVGGSTTATAPGNRAASGASGGGGSMCKVGFFQIASLAQSVVFVVDRSASMGPTGCFSAAKNELLAAIQALPATSRFQVIVYNRVPTTLRINGHMDLVNATEANKEAAAQCITELRTEGATDHIRALQAALLLRPDAIYFVTDADDLRADQVHALTVLNHGRSTIHAIEFAGDRRRPERSLLQVLAEQNQGQFRSVRPSPD